jgi:hypothetical protein
MKKNILSLSALVLVAATLITSCNKEDTTAPVVTLTGAASMTISLQDTYTEAGATATDDEDGDITPTVSGAVNEDLAGTYTITYTATDAAGNTGTATRTVIVENDAAALAGTYNVSDLVSGVTNPFTYTQTITVSTTVNNRIMFNKFADYANNGSIYANVTGTNIDLPSQTAVSIGTNNGGTCDVANHTFVGTGSTSMNGFTLNYTDQLVGPSGCSGAAVSGVATYTKQ